MGEQEGKVKEKQGTGNVDSEERNTVENEFVKTLAVKYRH